MCSIFSPKDPAFATYAHNAIILCSMPLMTTSFVDETSIAKLTIAHRDTIHAVRTPEFVQSYIHWVNSPAIGA
jgi:hypothetical protein